MRLLPIILVLVLAACGEGRVLPFTQTKELVVITRTGATTYSVEKSQDPSGFDYDLAKQLAEELDLKLRIVVAASDADILKRLENNEGHLAAAWQTPGNTPGITSSRPYYSGQDVLVTHEASLPITRIEQIGGRTVHVISGSRQAATLRQLQARTPGLNVIETKRRSELDLLERVARQRYEATIVDEAVFDIASNYYPELQGTLAIGSALPIVWLFPPNSDPELIKRANDFLDRIEKNGSMARLKDRYFGHVQRLKMEDRIRFIERIDTVLPRYKKHFQEAQINTGIDWRMLAALAYQESHWEPLATSPTGVRGMMMLTEDTADHLGVKNRLDAEESIRAGAYYLNELREALPASIQEPDRLWMALAAYNLGMGHFKGAREIARMLKVNPDSWYEMKKVLPLLAQPEYYRRLKSGRARGGEAVILTENIRIYANILERRLPAYEPLKAQGPKKTAKKPTKKPVKKQAVSSVYPVKLGKSAPDRPDRVSVQWAQ